MLHRFIDLPAESGVDTYVRRDARYRLHGRHLNPQHGASLWRMGLDYAHREVRDYYFTMMRELAEDYQYEGLELDWNRFTLLKVSNKMSDE